MQKEFSSTSLNSFFRKGNYQIPLSKRSTQNYILSNQQSKEKRKVQSIKFAFNESDFFTKTTHQKNHTKGLPLKYNQYIKEKDSLTRQNLINEVSRSTYDKISKYLFKNSRENNHGSKSTSTIETLKNISRLNSKLDFSSRTKFNQKMMHKIGSKSISGNKAFNKYCASDFLTGSINPKKAYIHIYSQKDNILFSPYKTPDLNFLSSKFSSSFINDSTLRKHSFSKNDKTHSPKLSFAKNINHYKEIHKHYKVKKDINNTNIYDYWGSSKMNSLSCSEKKSLRSSLQSKSYHLKKEDQTFIYRSFFEKSGVKGQKYSKNDNNLPSSKT